MQGLNYLFFYIKKYGKQIFYTIAFILFWIKGIIFLDPDFGWRLVTGGLILTGKIPYKDPFSYSMPSFPFVDHAWSQSLLFSILFHSVGKVGLALVYTLFAFLALRVAHSVIARNIKKDLVQIFKNSLSGNYGDFANFIYLLTTSLLFVFFGVRVQVLTWVFLSLFLKVVFDEGLWERYRSFLPLLFIVWANIHGGFASGLISLLIIFFARFVSSRKIDYYSIFLLVACLLSTLINPYGFGVWREVWSSIADQNLRWSINEWMPAITMLNLPMVLVGTLSSVFVWKQRKFLKLEEFLLFFFFLLQAVGSRRHLPLMVLVGLPIVSKAIWTFYLELKTRKDAIKRLYQAYKWAWIGVLVIILFQLFFDYSEGISLTEENYYPKDAVEYLKENPTSGEIFSEYGWGGYLIWKIPEKKVFIDGRMPSWSWKAPPGELDSAFKVYSEIIKGDLNYDDIFNKYNIRYVLWTRQKEDNPLDIYFEKIENFLIKFGYKKKRLKLLKQLEEDGWKKIYQNNKSEIYERQSASGD